MNFQLMEIQDIESTGEIEVSFSNSENFNFLDLKSEEFIDGLNSIIFELRDLFTNEVLLRKNFSINFEKYPNKINLTPSVNITKNSKVKIEGKTSFTNHPIRYILNPKKKISSLSSLKEISINPDGSFEFFVNNLFEGKNLIKVFSLEPNSLVEYTGEAQTYIIKDTKPPKFEIVEGSLDFETNNLYTNIKKLKLNISINENATVSYIFNGRDEEVEILEKGDIEEIDFITSFSVEKKNNNLEFKFTRKENFKTSYLRYSYDNIEKDKIDFENNIATILIELEEEEKVVEIDFYNGKGSSSKKDFTIHPYTFEDVRSTEKQANKIREENIWTIEENLVERKNTLLIIAKDIANNTAKLSKVVFFSKKKPKLIRETLKPEEIFPKSGSGTTHFFTSSIEGKTNKPFVEGKVFTFPKNSKVIGIDGETSKSVRCEDYNFLLPSFAGKKKNKRKW